MKPNPDHMLSARLEAFFTTLKETYLELPDESGD